MPIFADKFYFAESCSHNIYFMPGESFGGTIPLYCVIYVPDRLKRYLLIAIRLSLSALPPVPQFAGADAKKCAMRPADFAAFAIIHGLPGRASDR